MELNTEHVMHAGQRALGISDSPGADEYVNPPAGYTSL